MWFYSGGKKTYTANSLSVGYVSMCQCLSFMEVKLEKSKKKGKMMKSKGEMVTEKDKAGVKQNKNKWRADPS